MGSTSRRRGITHRIAMARSGESASHEPLHSMIATARVQRLAATSTVALWLRMQRNQLANPTIYSTPSTYVIQRS